MKAAAVVVALGIAGGLVAAVPASAGTVRDVTHGDRLFNEAVGGALDADGLGGSAVVTAEPSDAASQGWILHSAGNGAVQLESAGWPGLCLEAPQSIGDPVGLAPCTADASAQRWMLERVSGRHVIAEAANPDYAVEAVAKGESMVKAWRDDNRRQLWDVTPA
ncbi:RICIN domain-containing protein [Kitasatospora sp. NPDC094011]|uniref:RICIN domain-containing protein n=1 Tax=Kitasatospora sp. NPDC094011 TaxID=3364090 RepID=UPI00380CC651